jgi:hypothetical protein
VATDECERCDAEQPETGRLWLDQHAGEPVYEFKLLRSASVQEIHNPLADIPVLFLSFERQEDAGRKSKSFGHRNDGIETRHCLAPFNVPPRVRGYVTAFGGFLETEFGAPPQLTNAFRELRMMFHSDGSR